MTGLIFILAFICGFLVYRMGITEGYKMAKGKTINPIIKKQKKLTEEEIRVNKGIENILNYANRKKEVK